MPARSGTAESWLAFFPETGKQPMFHNAFALFFIAVLAGSTAALHAVLRSNLILIAAVLQGRARAPVEERTRPRRIRVRSGRRLAFAPVAFRICRL